MNKKVGVISLGCPKNRVDSEIMIGQIKAQGYEITTKEEEAEIIVINTCGFMDAAKKESIDTILETAHLKKTGKLKKLVVAGCLSERYGKDLIKELSEVDFFLGVEDKTALRKIFSPGQRQTSEKLYREKDFLNRTLTTPFYTAYVKIAEGCSNRCSFCIIPKIRGPFRSRPQNAIIKEVKKLVNQGVKEINLVAQDTTLYGIDLGIKEGLTALLKELVKIKDLEWIRILYCYPAFLTEKLLDLMGQEEKICAYIDLPLQHSHPDILKMMLRQEDEKQILNLIELIRKKVKGAAIRTSFIVGFPGEEEKHFNHLENFIRQINFNHVGIFSYSQEEGTKAAEFSHQIPDKIKKERYKHLMQIQQKISLEKNRQLVGKIKPVLIEGATGRLATQAPEIDGVIILDKREYAAGEIIPIKITQAMEYDLVGESPY